MTETIVDRLTISEIREYRTIRIAKIKNGETPKVLDSNNGLSKIIFHLVPKKAFAPAMIFNLSWLHKSLDSLNPIYSSIWNGQYNSEGFCTYGHSVTNAQGSVGSYVQVFHNGIVEAVDLRLLLEGYMNGKLFKEGLTEALCRFLSCIQKLGIETPIFAMLSLVNIEGFHLFTGQDYTETRKIEKEDVLIPEVQIDDFSCAPSDALQPIFDIVWNAFGLPKSSS
jgi:hypothetical protein